MTVPKDHPRYRSLVTRERIADGVAKGLVHPTGLVAHGRGEAFDYLLGERTTPGAVEAARAAAAHLLLARHPVLSVNGNTAVLCPEEMAALAREVPARLEVNLFHRTDLRVRAILEHLRRHGAAEVLGEDAAPRIPGLSSDRGTTSAEGIAAADVVLVPLEDGDRAEALKRMGKVVLVVDLNPLSRTAKAADVCIVDEVTRAVPNVTAAVREIRPLGRDAWREIVAAFDARENRRTALRAMAETAWLADGSDGRIEPRSKLQLARLYARALLVLMPILAMFAVKPWVADRIWWPTAFFVFSAWAYSDMRATIASMPVPYDSYLRWLHASRAHPAFLALSAVSLIIVSWCIVNSTWPFLSMVLAIELGIHVAQFVPRRDYFADVRPDFHPAVAWRWRIRPGKGP